MSVETPYELITRAEAIERGYRITNEMVRRDSDGVHRAYYPSGRAGFYWPLDDDEVGDVGWETEVYPAAAATELAQLLLDTGLLFQVNAAVLHHHGLALGMTVDEDSGRVTGLNLHRTSDPDGVWFDEAAVVLARQKMRAAGILLHRDPDTGE